ncbi:MAG: bifunctional UDP-N-acetylglucosamine diphosphorylase/glucosamine-1-phosphate N-acetyltransferase GlmU [Polyangiales bacterium]
MSSTEVLAIVLAAGQGTRMKSETPKVLHEIAGKPLVAWAVDAALEAGMTRAVVVVGHGGERVETSLRARFGDRVSFALQAEQKGTGHAVRCAMDTLPGYEGRVVILYGDCPLLSAATIRELVTASTGAKLGLLTAHITDPTGYGRILRDDTGRVRAIREHKDASLEERAIHEVNPGVYCIDAGFLRSAIATLDTNNAQGELYLTDVVEAAARQGSVVDVEGDMAELRGVNDRYELALCAKIRRAKLVEALARSGVGVADPDTLHVDADCIVEPDAWLGANVHLRGRTVVRRGARIDVGSVLTDVEVAENALVKPYSVAEKSVIGPSAEVGPFSHLRPETELGPKAKVGNFSETKKTKIGARSKVPHLAYVGDGILGEDVNVGAGTIFCNYDGYRKHTTVLEDGVFIGSDSQLVAPIRVGKGAYVGSGTTVTKDVPAGALAISRPKQENKEGMADKLRARMEAAKKADQAKKSGSPG